MQAFDADMHEVVDVFWQNTDFRHASEVRGVRSCLVQEPIPIEYRTFRGRQIKLVEQFLQRRMSGKYQLEFFGMCRVYSSRCCC